MPKAVRVKKSNDTTTTITGTKSAVNAAVAHNNVGLPDWPAFAPILPTESLCIDTVMPHQILTISQFFTATLCKTYINFLAKLPLITTPKQAKRGEAIRVNDRFQIQDPTFAKRLWIETGLKDILENEENSKLLWTDNESRNNVKPWGLNPNIRIYRYTPGQHFAKHCAYLCLCVASLYYVNPNITNDYTVDEANVISVGAPPASRRTIYTLLIYLTGAADGVVGGETVFYPEAPYVPLTKKQMRERTGLMPQKVECAPERGMALLHRHGDECLLHEGKEVEEGVKWVIRSDLVVDI